MELSSFKIQKTKSDFIFGVCVCEHFMCKLKKI